MTCICSAPAASENCDDKDSFDCVSILLSAPCSFFEAMVSEGTTRFRLANKEKKVLNSYKTCQTDSKSIKS